MKQNRFKSPVVWLSAAALVGFVSKTYFGYTIPEFDTLVNLVLVVLMGFGIINNPESKNSL